MPFESNYLKLSDGRRIFYVVSKTKADKPLTPVIAIHGLGGTSSFWLPALEASGLAAERDLYAYDFDGHGGSDWSGRELSIEHLAQDLDDVLCQLGLPRVVLAGHSMNGTVTSVYAAAHPQKVERLILLHPVRNMPEAAQANMRARAKAASSVAGLSTIAQAVASTAIAQAARGDESLKALIRHMVASTKPAAYGAACIALANAPHVDGKSVKDAKVPVHIIGGQEDYLAGPAAVQAWAEEAGGSCAILEQVGHWGAVERPSEVGFQLRQALAPTSYYLFTATFRSPYVYTLSFNTETGKLALVQTNKAKGGHSWLSVSADEKVLYTTNWSDSEEPSVSCYAIGSSKEEGANGSGANPFPTIDPSAMRTAPAKYLSGYVCANSKMLYSASGPQLDVFELDEQGLLREQPSVQTFSLVNEEDRHKGKSVLDFGGLRHGGHSCDLSPDGTKLYVADIGRNCVWVYHVDLATGRLTEASKSIATRPHDGPRHAWPHPNGKVVYSLQEHSSHVDAFSLMPDGSLQFLEGASILPPGDDCARYWADEVRVCPRARTVFGSTRGLEASTKGWVAAWRIAPALDGTGEGRFAADIVAAEKAETGSGATHRIQTRTSGGWANAIAVCPTLGPRGEVFLTLTDHEEGFIQMLSYTDEDGFKVLDELVLKGLKGESVGASVAAWLPLRSAV